MKKIFNILILFIFSIVLFGCIEPNIITPSYKVDLTLIDDEMYINDFDVSLIRIKYTDANGDVTFISCNENMFTEEDYNKLKTVGTHTVTVIYKFLQEQITITLKRNENVIYDNDLKVYFINVGQADCIFVMLPNGKNLLIDAGLDHATSFGDNNFPSWKNIIAILNKENIKTIDYVIVTHNHSDHYYYIQSILTSYNVKEVYMSGSTTTSYTYLNILETMDNLGIEGYEVSVGDKIINEDQLTLQVVSTKKENNPEDANFCSVCVKLTYNQKSFLFMGDAGCKNKQDGEYIAINSGIDLKSDVLKVGHHGSTYASSRDFLKLVLPEYAVITTSSVTTTGHPHTAAMNRLKSFTNNILQSKTDGTILFISDGVSLKVETHIGE